MFAKIPIKSQIGSQTCLQLRQFNSTAASYRNTNSSNVKSKLANSLNDSDSHKTENEIKMMLRPREPSVAVRQKFETASNLVQTSKEVIYLSIDIHISIS